MRHVYCVFNLVQQRVYAFRKQNDWSYRHDLSRPLSRPPLYPRGGEQAGQVALSGLPAYLSP